MATIPAIKTLLRREVLRALKEDLVYVVQDGDTGNNLESDAIVLQKTSVRKNREGESTLPLMDLPGIVLSSPRRTTIPPEGGTNEREDWTYEWMIQICDADSWEEDNRLASVEKWVEQVVSFFSHNLGLISDAVTEDETGCTVVGIVATDVADVDETLWVRSARFVAGVHLMIVMRQPRGAIP